MDPDFERAFTRIVAPQLDHLGFRMITQPEGWIIPSKLYEREPVWFGADWDWRDGDLAVTVGRLFRFRDFMPRVIVRGPYHYDVIRESEKLGSFLSRHLGLVVQELPDAVEHMQERWPTTSNLERERWERTDGGKAAHARYLSCLGPELTLASWPGRPLR